MIITLLEDNALASSQKCWSAFQFVFYTILLSVLVNTELIEIIIKLC